MSAMFTPELYNESIVQEQGWEAVARVYNAARVAPLTGIPTNTLLSIMDKSRLVWGGQGVTVAVPSCVRSIAPLTASLREAGVLALNAPDILKDQASNLDYIVSHTLHLNL